MEVVKGDSLAQVLYGEAPKFNDGLTMSRRGKIARWCEAREAFDGTGAAGCEEVRYWFWSQLRKFFIGEPERSQFSLHFLYYDLLADCEFVASAIAFSDLHLVDKIAQLEGCCSADCDLLSYPVVRNCPVAEDIFVDPLRPEDFGENGNPVDGGHARLPHERREGRGCLESKFWVRDM